MKNRFTEEQTPYFVIFILCLLLMYFQFTLGCLSLILCGVVYWQMMQRKKDTEHELRVTIEKVYTEMDKLNKKKLYDLPIALVLLSEKGEILWYNDYFLHSFRDSDAEETLYGKNICDALSLDPEIINKERQTAFSYEGADYSVVSKRFEDNGDTLVLLHFFDVTVQKRHEALYKEYGTVFGYILIDNYDEVIEQLPSHERSTAAGKIDLKINEWATRHEAFVLPYENDHYLILFEKERLKDMETERFNVLDAVRDAFKEESLQATLSIGVGVSEEIVPVKTADEIARAALDIALARGGDQAVVRKDEKIAFYGGSSEATEKRTKVKARIKAHGLQEFIKEADNVLIMGHQTPDMDCLGAAVGLLGVSHQLGKTAKMILKEINYSIKELFEYIMEDEAYANAFITPQEIESYLRQNTLLIIVDTQNANYLEVPEILDRVAKTVIIDHHRRSGKFISQTVMSYTEVYASSTCELVTELLQYFDVKKPMGEVEANALLCGICMDTKMFTFKTGVRTFEAASYLRRKGADTAIAKTMLKDDFDTYNSRSEAVRNAKTYFGNFAISEITNNTEYAKTIAAQAADELLNIKGIQASFVILNHDGGIFVSGRSMGDVNVQLILEKMGGGGHLTIAGAQLEDIDDLEKGKEILLSAIEEYFNEIKADDDKKSSDEKS